MKGGRAYNVDKIWLNFHLACSCFVASRRRFLAVVALLLYDEENCQIISRSSLIRELVENTLVYGAICESGVACVECVITMTNYLHIRTIRWCFYIIGMYTLPWYCICAYSVPSILFMSWERIIWLWSITPKKYKISITSVTSWSNWMIRNVILSKGLLRDFSGAWRHIIICVGLPCWWVFEKSPGRCFYSVLICRGFWWYTMLLDETIYYFVDQFFNFFRKMIVKEDHWTWFFFTQFFFSTNPVPLFLGHPERSTYLLT